jgi:membrane fusion protein, adhesin transport system
MKGEDLDFMSDLAASANLKPSRASNLLLWGIAGFFAWAFIWAAFAKVDERVHGTGQVMPSSDIQTVQSLEGGILSELSVAEGDHVKKGQVLLRIDDIQFASEGRGIEAQMTALKARQARLKSETSGADYAPDPAIAQKYPDIAANEEKLYLSRKQQLESSLGVLRDEVREAEANLSEVQANIAQFSRSRDLLNDEMKITRRLVEQKAVPEIEKLRLERALNEAQGNLASALQGKASLEARLSGAKRKEEGKRSEFRSLALAELNDAESRLTSIGASLDTVNDKVDRAGLKSPVDGIVQKVHVRTLGGVVQPAQKLVEIVPETDDLLVRARIAPADVAFLKPGQPVRVTVTAYDPQIYGTLEGRLERIGAGTVENQRGEPFFEIDVRTLKNALDNAGGRALPILPGMVAEADVIVGRRTILTYLMKPVLRAKDKAFTEK